MAFCINFITSFLKKFKNLLLPRNYFKYVHQSPTNHQNHRMKRSYYIVALIMLTFFVISFITNIIGPLSPEFKKDFHLSDTLSGVIPFAFFIAYGIMSIPTSMLVQKYNEKKIMVMAFIVAFLGSLLIAAFPNYLTVLISLYSMSCNVSSNYSKANILSIYQIMARVCRVALPS